MILLKIYIGRGVWRMLNKIKREDIKIVYDTSKFCPWCVYKGEDLMDCFNKFDNAKKCQKNLLEIAEYLGVLI